MITFIILCTFLLYFLLTFTATNNSNSSYKELLDREVRELAHLHLKPFKVITREMISRSKIHALNKHNSRNTTLIFSVSEENGTQLTINSSKFHTSHLWDQQRFLFINSTLSEILDRHHFNIRNFEFIYNSHDCPVRKLFHYKNSENLSFAPIFGNLKCNEIILPFPQWYYRRDGSFFKMSWFINHHWRRTWKWRTPKGIFRGSYRTSCLDMNFIFHNMNMTNAGECGRGKLLKLAHHYPNLLDVGLFSENEHDEFFLANQSWYERKDAMTLEQQSAKFRYVIYAEGNCGWADRLKLLLTTGMLIFLQETPCSEWYFGLMKPFVHYIPVKNDWSNLKEMIEWAIENDQKSQQIVSNSMKLGRYLMDYSVWMDYLYELLFEYSERIER